MKEKHLLVAGKISAIVVLIVVLFIVFALICFEVMCLLRIIGLHFSFSNKIGSTWVSETEDVEYRITEFSGGYGTITINGETHNVEISVITSMQRIVFRENHGDSEENIKIEDWIIIEQKTKLERFKIVETITFEVKETTYFEDGQLITFYRIK